jgi:hypothetical protein
VLLKCDLRSLGQTGRTPGGDFVKDLHTLKAREDARPPKSALGNTLFRRDPDECTNPDECTRVTNANTSFMYTIKKNLIMASSLCLIITTALLVFSLREYVLWINHPIEDHAKLVSVYKTAIFNVFPAISFASFVAASLIIFSLKGFSKRALTEN